LDLRSPNAQDPDEVTQAREVEMAHIKSWIAEYQDYYSFKSDNENIMEFLE